MPASLYQNYTGGGGGGAAAGDNSNNMEDNRAVKLAYELAMLGLDNVSAHAVMGGGGGSPATSPLTIDGGGLPPHHHHQHPTLAQLEELKNRKSQNMTECVPVPSSEHVAEIVGRQGCKIKALRAKTNTYIKTPVRGEEPVFVVTGRKEDVGLAKREILSAAEHFSQIRASRKNNINSTLAFGQMVANTPGQTTIQVRVPYRVVGLVVGPKGATIKRIQQQTQTYIVTPSREKDPVFEVTGLPENVDTARKEIEAHIALRTGSGGGQNGGLFDSVDSLDGDMGTNYSSAFSNSGSSGLNSLLSDQLSNGSGGGGSGHGCNGIGSSSSSNGVNGNNLLTKYSTNSILNGMNHHHHHHSGQPGITNGMGGGGSNSMMANNQMEDHLQLHSLIESNNFDSKFNLKNSRDSAMHHSNGTAAPGSIGSTLWGCGGSGGGEASHDSGIGHSPPYDSSNSLSALSHGAAIWNELGKVLGNLTDSPTPAIGGGGGGPDCLAPAAAAPSHHHHNNAAISKTSPVTPRSASIDLGISLTTNNGVVGGGGPNSSHHHHHASALGLNEANNTNGLLVGGVNNMNGDHQLHSSSNTSPNSSSLPFTLNGLTSTLATLSASLTTLSDCGVGGQESGVGGGLLHHSVDKLSSHHQLIQQHNQAFCSVADTKPLGLQQRDFLSYPHH